MNEVDDAADDLDLGGLGASNDEGIEVVLRFEGIGYRLIAGKHASPGDRPVAVAGLAQLVDIGGQVRAVEAADADMDNAPLESAAVVGGDSDRRPQAVQRPALKQSVWQFGWHGQVPYYQHRHRQSVGKSGQYPHKTNLKACNPK